MQLRVLFLERPQEGNTIYCDHAQIYFGSEDLGDDLEAWLEGSPLHQVLIENYLEEEEKP